MANKKQVEIEIVGKDSASKIIANVEKSAGGLSEKLGGVAKIAGGFVVANALTGLGGKLLEGAKGAAEDEAAMLRLEQSVKNAGGSMDEYGGRIDEAIKKSQDLAFQDGETADALSLLTDMTGSSDEALKRLGSAQDLARAKGISLTDAAKLLGKVSDENTAALRKLGIQVGDNATAQDVLNEVDAKFKGQAGTFAESDAGKYALAANRAGELQEQLGSYLLPALALAVEGFSRLTDLIANQVIPSLEAVIAPIASLVGQYLGPLMAAIAAIGAVILASFVPAAIAWVAALVPVIASHIALAAATLVAYAPIIAILAAVGLAAAALYLAWDQNLFGIRDITQQVIDFIVPYFNAAMDGIKVVVEEVWPIVAAVVTTYINILKKEIEIALAIVEEVWNRVFPVIQTVVETVFPIIAEVVTRYINIAKTEIDLALTAIRFLFDNVLVPVQGVVENVFNTIKGTIDSTFNAAGGVLRIIEGGIASVRTIIEGAKEGILGAWGAITGGIQGAIQGIVEPIRGAVNSIIGFFNSLISGWNSLEFPGINMPGPVPDIPGVGTPNVPLIPLLARGGIVSKPTLAIVGDDGPEAVIPIQGGIPIHDVSGNLIGFLPHGAIGTAGSGGGIPIGGGPGGGLVGVLPHPPPPGTPGQGTIPGGGIGQPIAPIGTLPHPPIGIGAPIGTLPHPPGHPLPGFPPNQIQQPGWGTMPEPAPNPLDSLRHDTPGGAMSAGRHRIDPYRRGGGPVLSPPGGQVYYSPAIAAQIKASQQFEASPWGAVSQLARAVERGTQKANAGAI